MITAAIHLNLASQDRDRDRKAVTSLYGQSAGTKVTVFVGHRQHAEPETARWLAEYAIDLHLEITGDPAAVESWSSMIREAA